MASPELIEKWRQIEQHLRAALQLHPDMATPAQMGDINMYLDHNELGLAYEAILWIAAENGLAIGDIAGEHLDRAAELMAMTTGAWKLSVADLRKVL